MKIEYDLTETARRAVFLATGRELPARQRVSVDGAALSSEARAALVAINPELRESVELRVPQLRPGIIGSALGWTVYASDRHLDPPTTDGIAALLSEHAAARATAQAWIDAECDAALVAHIDALRERLARPRDPQHDTTPQIAAYLTSRPLAEEAQRLVAAVVERDRGEALAAMRQDAEKVLTLTAPPRFYRASDFQLSKEQLAHADGPATAARCAAAVAHIKALETAAAERAAAEKERREAEKRQWIGDVGSAYLKRCLAGGYNCQRAYVIERAGVEFPGYVVDYNDAAAWKDRAAPSEKALVEAERVGGVVVWLTDEPSNRVAESDDDSQDYGFEPCEAVVVREYLGKYDLVKLV
jgi:hypothetical protein